MGQCYSLNGYVNAVLRRSAKTLLVEGVSDISMLNRLLAEDLANRGGSVIDSACIVNDEEAQKYGNKERVVYLRGKIIELSERFPKLESRFASLVDREWDGLKFDGVRLEGEWAPPEQLNRCFVTVGHSIENYCINSGLVVDYLRYLCPGEIDNQIVELLKASFSRIVDFGVCYSICARDFSCIKRCLGLLKVEHLSYQDSFLFLNQKFSNLLSSRGYANAEGFVNAVNKGVKLFQLEDYDDDVACKILHGHLGNEALWAGVGVVLELGGLDQAVVSQVVTGWQKERERFSNDWVARNLSKESLSPLDEVVDWMNRPTADA